MRITNHARLPKAIVDAIRQSQSEYDNGGSFLSASSALKPPRIFWLEKRHSDDLEVDAVDLIWSFVGTAVHFAAEKAGQKDKNTIAEERYFTEVLGEKISAQIDNYEPKRKILTDFKITSVYSLIGEPKEDWVWQLNIQKYLMELHGYEVDKIQIAAVGRDWSKNRAKQTKDYPKHQVKLIKIPIKTREEVEEFLEGRVSLLLEHKNTPDSELPPCTPEERWAKPTQYAVMEKGKKRATKLHESEIEARQHVGNLQAKGKEVNLEVREGEDTRCIGYCNVSKFCTYAKEKGYVE